MTRFAVGDKAITPIEMSAQILKTLAAVAEECLFAAPTGAVITVLTTLMMHSVKRPKMQRRLQVLKTSIVE